MGYRPRRKNLRKRGLLRRAKQGYTGIIANFGYSKFINDAVPAFPSTSASIAPPPQAL